MITSLLKCDMKLLVHNFKGAAIEVVEVCEWISKFIS